MLQPRVYRTSDGRSTRVTLSICPSGVDCSRNLQSYVIESRPAKEFGLSFDRSGEKLVKRRGELKGLVHALARARISHASIFFSDPPAPDFEVRLEGKSAFVEVSEVRQHAEIFAALQAAQATLAAKLLRPDRILASGDLSFTFRRMPRRQMLPAFLERLAQWIEQQSPWSRDSTYNVPAELSPYLGAVSIANRLTDQPITFTLLGNAAVTDYYAAALRSIDQKTKKRYVGEPIWLAINMAAGFDNALQRLRGVDIERGPFERLIVTDGQDILTFEHCPSSDD